MKIQILNTQGKVTRKDISKALQKACGLATIEYTNPKYLPNAHSCTSIEFELDKCNFDNKSLYNKFKEALEAVFTFILVTSPDIPIREENEMRTLQEVFNTVIEHQLYFPRKGMCIAIYRAFYLKLITREERDTACCHIQDYLRYLDILANFLFEGLQSNDLPSSDSDLLNIYMNWDSRPFPAVFYRKEEQTNFHN